MKRHNLRLASLLAAIVLSASAIFGQDTFADPAADYSFTIPDATWKVTIRPTSTNSTVELVYGDRRNGHLSVRRLTVPKDTILSDLIEDESQTKLQLSKQGYVAGKEENFGGKLRGSVFNFEYVAGGKNMGGRYYFLRGNDTTVYVLQFTGPKEDLRGLRNQTDLIARTFGVK